MTEFDLKSRDYIGHPERKREFNKKLFSAIAPEYAGMSRVLSLGRDASWKRRMVEELPGFSAPNCLDLACGNGDLSVLLLGKYPRASVAALDLCAPMLGLARERLTGRGRVEFIQGDMLNTGLPGGKYDILTVGYGLRNAPELKAAIDETARLLKPRGFLAVLDFSKPDMRCLAAIELMLLRIWCGAWGLIRSRNVDTYGYIADSLTRFPSRPEFHALLGSRGYEIVNTRRHFGGIVESVIAQKRSL